MLVKIALFSIIFTSNLFAKTSAEIWKNFSGETSCEVGSCAEEIPTRPLELALNYFKKHKDEFQNQHHLGIIDMRLSSTVKRLFILNLNNGTYRSLLVTHGKKSEDKISFAGYFSNTPGSEMSSLGFYKTDVGPYFGKHGESLRLMGLSKTNSNALERGIVIHSADYATQDFINERGRLGLSQGCPAVSPDDIDYVINRLEGEGLLLIYSTEFEAELKN